MTLKDLCPARVSNANVQGIYACKPCVRQNT